MGDGVSRLPVLKAGTGRPAPGGPPAGGAEGSRFAIVTLGCKLNQFDSAEVAGRLLSARRRPSAPEEADLVVLNTCTVTHKADRDARKLIRAIRRDNPAATVAVMGCSARLEAEVYRAMPEVDAVLPSAEAVEAFLGVYAPAEGRDHGCVPYFGDRTRAYLKVQEGCNFPCTYCIIPTVRGRSRSVHPDRAVLEFRAFLEAGYREVVLTGVNTGEWGKDIGVRGGLAALVERLLTVEGDYRLRLNSVEPRAVTGALRSLLRSEVRVARHLQVPLQSGSDAVLSAMRRNYTAARYEELVARLADDVPGIGIGSDVLVGFPTETPSDLDATLALLERSPVAFVHAFTYSPRPGTSAARLKPLPPPETARRAESVRALGARKKRAFAERFLGGEALPAITLAAEGGRGRALTDNFLTVTLPEPLPANRMVRVALHSVDAGEVAGRCDRA